MEDIVKLKVINSRAGHSAVEVLDPLERLEEGPGCGDPTKLLGDMDVGDVAEEDLLVAPPTGHGLVCEMHGGKPNGLLVDGSQEII